MHTSRAAGVTAAIIDAFERRDVESFVSYMTEDVVLEPSAFITGRGRYQGRADILAGFREMERDLEGRGEKVRLSGFRYFVDAARPDAILSPGFVTITRASGDEFGTEIAYLWEVAEGKVTRLRTWLDHSEGLAQLTTPVEVAPAAPA